jgi:serine/threonine protein kinase
MGRTRLQARRPIRANASRDLHPGNILLTTRILTQLRVHTDSELSVRLCDLGQSRLVTEASPGAFSNQKAATRYRAPELSAKGATHTKATDVFAAGAFIFDALSLAARATADPKDPVLVPRGLWELCEQCTSTEPGKRPEAIQAVFTLERLQTDEYGEKHNLELIDLKEALRHLHMSSMSTSSLSSVEDVDSLLSPQSLQDSVGSFF